MISRNAECCISCAAKNHHKKQGHTSKEEKNSNSCVDCGIKISWQAKRCRSCATKLQLQNPTPKQIEQRKAWQDKGREIAIKLPRSEKQIRQHIECLERGREKLAKTYVSSWEDLFFEYLRNRFSRLEIKRQFRLIGLNHPFDFAIPKLRILIEIDCDYWHNMPNVKRRDFEVNTFVDTTDWKLFRFNDAKLKMLGIL